MKYAVIGTSWITKAFIDAAKTVDGMELVAVYSRTAEKARGFAEETGAECIYTDLEEFAKSNLFDAVYIASPNSLHFGQSKLMLEAGKHVICEKPAAVRPEEIEELIQLARNKKLVYMEAIMFLHTPWLTMLKEAISKIGRVFSADLNFSQLSSKYGLYKSGMNPNIFNPEFCTGCLMDIGVYNVYTALELFGTPMSLKAKASLLETGIDACGSSIFDYADKLVTLTYSKTGQSHAPSQIFGDKGTVLIDSISQLEGIRVVYSDGTKETVTGELSRTEIMACEARAFRDFAADYDKHVERLYYAQGLSAEVSRVMLRIREDAGNYPF